MHMVLKKTMLKLIPYYKYTQFSYHSELNHLGKMIKIIAIQYVLSIRAMVIKCLKVKY